ncbi:CsiV family protein [Sulfuriflexus sp.]|uniref:CsiV family protein n=1 Tax=Sulfuriflexus sp. TaxID=2015443 RepID=UPI0028CD37F6|nr:CsiV family protein [Sulfuriflexus sp.]MDT8403696.1 CsiV family protein [Sulfuriflexus sp.]
MITKHLKTLFFAALLCLAGPATAQEAGSEQSRWYQVELIFFETLEPAAAGEHWPLLTSEATTGGPAIELAAPLQPVVVRDNPGINPRAFQLLNPENFALTDISRQLLASRQYRILNHIAWRQPTVDKSQARAVHVHDKLMREKDRVPSPLRNEPLLLNNLPDPLEQADGSVEKKRFDGTVTVSVSRYLHLKADITYYNPDVYLGEQIARQNIDTPNIEHFKLVESRRMRSKEVHYLDHPYFGIIALITPYERGAE